MNRKIIHIDMDCFFAAIEIRDRPELSDKPIAVGGSTQRRGVISTCNYIARQYGVHSAMATAHALKLCPELIVLSGSFEKYRAASSEVKAICQRYTNEVEPLSIDEMFLDVSEVDANQKGVTHQGSATRIAAAIRYSIERECQLIASAGVAPNKFLAKVGSDWRKPDGLFVIPPDKVSEFILRLPVARIPGVGRVTQQKLTRMGVSTCADLQAFSLIDLINAFGRYGQTLYHRARGIDHRQVNTQWLRKSLSLEVTFPQDLISYEECLEKIPELHEDLLKRLHKHKERTIKSQFVKIKFNDFSSTTVEHQTHDAETDPYVDLLQEGYFRKSIPVRLLGLGVRFTDGGVSMDAVEQLSLLP